MEKEFADQSVIRWLNLLFKYCEKKKKGAKCENNILCIDGEIFEQRMF